MIKLMYANLYRLKKNICFYILLVIAFMLGIYFYINYNGLSPNGCVNCVNQLGNVLFLFLQMGWILLPIFTNNFMRPLYNNGIIKNMIIMGHKRKNIYFANLFTTIIESVILSFMFILGTVLTSLYFISDITIPNEELLFLIFDSILLSISYASLFTFISMSFTKVASTSLSFMIVIWGIIIPSNIFSNYNMPNISSKLHQVYEIILSFLPSGQMLLITNLAGVYKYLWLYSIIFIIITTYLGIMIINKKELN